MTKQEEIRGGIEKIRREALGNDCSGYLTDAILNYLHSQGVVIKVERELPILAKWQIELHYPWLKEYQIIAAKQAEFMFNTGYVAVEPLIKEE